MEAHLKRWLIVVCSLLAWPLVPRALSDQGSRAQTQFMFLKTF